MNKNGILFAVFLGLLTFTYFFQERRAENDYEASLTKDHLITHSINSLSFGGYEFVRKDDQWWSGKTLVSQNLMKQIEKKLQSIRKLKDLTGDSAKFFQNPLSLEVDGKKMLLGDFGLDKEGFYVSYDNALMLATIEGENTELTANEHELPRIKLNELKALMSKSFVEYKENQLFRFYSQLPLKRVVVKMDGHLDYELDFEKNETLPPPISGIEVQDKLQQKFIAVLTQMTIKEEIPWNPKLKYKMMGSLTFQADSKQVVWELWLRSKDSADALIIDDKRKRVFLMIGGTLKGYFVQVQDYWDKKVIPPSKFHHFTKLAMTISQGPLTDRVFIINSNPLKFEATTHQVNIEKMDELLGYLFNLGPHDQAMRVSQLSSSEKKQILSEDHLKVEVMDEEILFWKKAHEIILVNLTRGFKSHFMLNDKSMEFDFKDVLE